MHTKRRHLAIILSLLMALAVHAADTTPFSALQPSFNASPTATKESFDAGKARGRRSIG